jgi:HAE1 family hydrophobic/amphiphilic exporter-1
LLAITDQDVDVSGTLPSPIGPVPAYESVLAEALKSRPDLDEIGHQRLVYNELKTIERAAARPRFDFAGGYGTRNIGMGFGSATGTTWNAAVIATVPLFDGLRTKGRIAQVQSDADRLALDEAKLRDAIALQVRAAVDAVEEASQIVRALDGTVAQAERLLFLSEKGFELGVNTRLDVQDAELNLTAARGNLARAQRDYRVALVNVDWVSGMLEAGSIKP